MVSHPMRGLSSTCSRDLWSREQWTRNASPGLFKGRTEPGPLHESHKGTPWCGDHRELESGSRQPWCPGLFYEGLLHMPSGTCPSSDSCCVSHLAPQIPDGEWSPRAIKQPENSTGIFDGWGTVMSLVLSPSFWCLYKSWKHYLRCTKDPRYAISAASRVSPVSRSSFQDLSPSVSQVFPSVADGWPLRALFPC